MDGSGRLVSPLHNRLLGALSPEVRPRLLSWMEKISLSCGQTLYASGAPLTYVWFPLTGVVSLRIQLKQADVEIATVGSEGFAGTAVYFGADSSPIGAACQVAGQVLRMRSDAFRRLLAEHPQLDHIVRRYAHTMINQTLRSSACNQLHSVRERLCRWLLVTQDRLGAADFNLTQDLVAHTLLVRRPSVTVVAGELRRERLIDYRRGRVRVLNRAGLEAGACECYEGLRQELSGTFGSETPRALRRAEGFGQAPAPPADGPNWGSKKA